MTGAASLVAVCIGRWNATRSRSPSSPGSSFSFAMSTRRTSIPSRRSHAAGDASPNGWRPMSYVEISSALKSCELGVGELRGSTRLTTHQLANSPTAYCVIYEHAGAGRIAGRTQPRWRPRVFRPSPRTVDAVLHRDVGALQLLRHARPAHPLHDRGARQRRSRLRHREGRRRLRPVYLDGVSADAAWRLARRPVARPAPQRPLWRHPDRQRPLQPGGPDDDDVLSGAGADRDRHGSPEREHRRPGRTALRPERQPPRRRVLDLLHGHQPRGVPGPAGVRLSRTARQLAPRLRRGRDRHGARPGAVRPRRPLSWEAPARGRRHPPRQKLPRPAGGRRSPGPWVP